MTHVNKNKKYFEEYARTASLKTLELSPWQWYQAIESAIRSGCKESVRLSERLNFECMKFDSTTLEQALKNKYHKKLCVSWRMMCYGLFELAYSEYGANYWEHMFNINDQDFPDAIRVRAIMISLRGTKANKEKQSNLKITATFERLMDVKLLPET